MEFATCELTILIPCLNEEETLGTCIQKARKYLSANDIDGEILISDNGSTDKSIEIANNLGARVVLIEEKGYGAALRGGIKAAKGKYIIMGDADDSYDFQKLDSFLERLRDGYDLVMGNRFKGGILSGAMPFLHQFIGNPVLSFIGRMFFKIKIGDFHCGLRGFNRESISKLNLRTTGMEFASEMIVQSSLNNLLITEVPTVLHPDGRSRKPYLRTWRDGWRHLRFLLLYSPNWLFFFPGIILMILGSLVSAVLTLGPLKINDITFDIGTLLFASISVLIGFEAFFFSIFTKVYAINQKLLPYDSQINLLSKKFKIEYGLIIGCLLIFIGLLGSLYAFFYWSSKFFGPLDPSIAMRISIPGSTLIALGSQIIFSSFFIGILYIKEG